MNGGNYENHSATVQKEETSIADYNSIAGCERRAGVDEQSVHLKRVTAIN